jgi:hypothetical protein
MGSDVLNILDSFEFLSRLKKKLAEYHTKPFATKCYVGKYNGKTIKYKDHLKKEIEWTGTIQLSWTMIGKRFRKVGKAPSITDDKTTFDHNEIMPMVLEVTVPNSGKHCYTAGWYHSHQHLHVEDGEFNFIADQGGGKPPEVQKSRLFGLGNTNTQVEPNVVFFIVDDIAIILDYVLPIAQYNETYQ